MSIRRTTTALAAVIGGAVLALPVAAHAAVPFDRPGDDDATADVPDTIDSLDLAGTRDQTAYTITVTYDDLESTPLTQRYVALADQGAKGRASRVKGNVIELRTNRRSVVSVHLYDYTDSATTTTITPVRCTGLSVVADDDADTVRYTLPRGCYFGATKPVTALIDAEDELFDDAGWDPARTFAADEDGPKPDASDSVGGTWRFAPAAAGR